MKYYIKPQEASPVPVPKSEKGIASFVQGVPGKSAYQVWLDAGNAGGASDFFASLKGEPGTPAPTPVASTTAVSGGTEVAFDMNADGTSDASFTVVDGVDGEDADPLTVESQTILETGNTQVSLSDGTTFEIQRGQQGKSVTVADSVINAEGDTEVTFSDGRTVVVQRGTKGDEGPKGDQPAFEWRNGTEVRFENPDGSWGEWQDLEGPSGGIDGVEDVLRYDEETRVVGFEQGAEDMWQVPQWNGSAWVLADLAGYDGNLAHGNAGAEGAVQVAGPDGSLRGASGLSWGTSEGHIKVNAQNNGNPLLEAFRTNGKRTFYITNEGRLRWDNVLGDIFKIGDTVVTDTPFEAQIRKDAVGFAKSVAMYQGGIAWARFGENNIGLTVAQGGILQKGGTITARAQSGQVDPLLQLEDASGNALAGVNASGAYTQGDRVGTSGTLDLADGNTATVKGGIITSIS